MHNYSTVHDRNDENDKGNETKNKNDNENNNDNDNENNKENNNENNNDNGNNNTFISGGDDQCSQAIVMVMIGREGGAIIRTRGLATQRKRRKKNGKQRRGWQHKKKGHGNRMHGGLEV